MALVSSTILFLCMVTCHSKRLKRTQPGLSAKMDAQMSNETDEKGDPFFCKDVPKPCVGAHIKQCPITCKGGSEAVEVVERPTPKDEVIHLNVVNEDMPPLALTKVTKSDLYKRAWPRKCDGTDRFGNKIKDLNTDRFLCDFEAQEVKDINDFGYRREATDKNPHPLDAYYSCCQGKCKEGTCDGKHTYDFAEAAKAALSLAALNAKQIVTEKGHNVQINVKSHDPAANVRATVEVRMQDTVLQFETATPKLTAQGEEFLRDLAGSLGPLISSQISAYDSPSKVVICTHAETTGTWAQMKGRPLQDLPKDRADTVSKVLQKVVPGEVASLGDGIAHYNAEVTGYTSGRRAFIIYKIYPSGVSPPRCERDDLHMFSDISDI